MVGSLLSIYRRLLPERPRLLDAVILVALAKVTGAGLSAGYLGQQGGPAAVLFAVLCHWLWRVLERGDWRSVAGSLVAAELVFFSKVNYALILVFLMPAFGMGLWALLREAAAAPGCETSRSLQNQLRATHLELVFPAPVRASLGAASVDVMPWDSSLAVVNGLTLRQRPVPQSYATFTPWLDELNARFLASPNAPDFVLYACPQETATDGRLAAWDESLTKRAFLENYAYAFQFKLPLRTIHDTSTSAPVYVMKHWPGACQLAPVATNLVRMTLGQPWRVPETTNLLFLTLNVERTVAGRMQGLVLCPSPLVAVITYQDGTTNSYRAVLPVLKTGVLLNRRVESPPEIYHWLKLEADRNLAVDSICFTSTSPWAFAAEFAGTVVACRVVNNGGAARDVENPEP